MIITKSLKEVDVYYVAIHSWLYLSGVVAEGAIHEFNNWLSFWHFRVRQWGGFMLNVRGFNITLYIETIFSSSFCTTSYIGKKYSYFAINPFLERKCKKIP
jgi:hypothetical protein